MRRSAYDFALKGSWPQAERLLTGLSVEPGFGADDWFTLGTARYRLGEMAEATQAARMAVEAEPKNYKAAHLLTLALMAQNRFSEALDVFEQHSTGPAREGYDFVLNHGAALSQLNRPQDALSVYLEAAALNISDPGVHMRLGIVLKDLKMFQESAESFLTAYTLDPKRFAAQLMVLHMRQFACRWEGFEAARLDIVQAMEVMQPDKGGNAEGGVWALAAIDHPPQLFKRAVQQVSAKMTLGIAPLAPRAVAPAGVRKIRVGYVSADFHNHATTQLMVEVLELRNQDLFEVTLYSHSPDDGSMIETRVRRACDRFVDMNAMSERQMAERIHADGIDILVDLKGHTFRNRLGVFAYRPAPIQVTWLGFPGTSGADFIDYFIGDRWVTPAEHADRYSERIAQMPHSYQPNDSRRVRPDPSTRARCGLPEGVPVMGCFNQSFKISPDNFAAWMRIMHAVPESVLWLLYDNAQAMDNLRLQARAHGIDPGRIVFAPRIPSQAHLARLPLADVMVDNWPCNAHTTASDALWMGVPMVTLAGEIFASRVAASLLNAVGLGELVCETAEQYEELVISLLRDPERVRALRLHLEEGRESFPLFDGKRFAADLEGLYGRMVERARAGMPSVALPAQDQEGH